MYNILKYAHNNIKEYILYIIDTHTHTRARAQLKQYLKEYMYKRITFMHVRMYISYVYISIYQAIITVLVLASACQ